MNNTTDFEEILHRIDKLTPEQRAAVVLATDVHSTVVCQTDAFVKYPLGEWCAGDEPHAIVDGVLVKVGAAQ